MSRRLIPALITLVTMTAAFDARPVDAQPPQPNEPKPLARTPFELESQIEPGDGVELVTGPDRRVLRGKVVDVSATSLVIATSSGVEEVRFDSIREVWRKRREGLKRKALAGTFLGAVLGGTARLGQGDCQDPESLCAKDGPFTAADFGGFVAGTTMITSAFWLKKERHLVFLNVPTPAVTQPLAADPLALSPPSLEWLAVGNNLEVGRPVTVGQDRGLRWHGTLAEISSSSITLIVDGQRRVLPREDVRRVWRGGLRSFDEAGQGGFFVGGLGGLLVAVVSCPGDDDDPAFDACFKRRGPAFLFGGWGIASGLIAVSIVRDNRHALVYDSGRSSPGRPASARRTTIQPVLGPGIIGVHGSVSF